MRKLKLQMQVTLDGFVAGANGELDWMVFDWDDPLKRYVSALTEPVDCIVLGRVLAERFIPAWRDRAGRPETADAFAMKMNATRKIVFSRTTTGGEWPGATLAAGILVHEVRRLKSGDGGDIIAYGGATFASELIHHELVDEFHLFVNPTAIGEGLRIFREPDRRVPMRLLKATAFACGIVALAYEPVRPVDRGL